MPVKLLKADPNHGGSQQLIGAIANMAPNNNESIASLKQFIEICHPSPILLYKAGSLYLENSPYLEAISTLTRALDLAPNHFESLHDLGLTYTLIGNKAAA